MGELGTLKGNMESPNQSNAENGRGTTTKKLVVFGCQRYSWNTNQRKIPKNLLLRLFGIVMISLLGID